jgi:hypothetical protein
VQLYEARKGDSFSRILAGLKKANPEASKGDLSFARIVWGYNRLGYSDQKELRKGDYLVLPGDLVMP